MERVRPLAAGRTAPDRRVAPRRLTTTQRSRSEAHQHVQRVDGIAITSLFIALGGPAQAASLLTGKNIRNSSLTGVDVKNNSLTSADVKGLRKGDFAQGQLPSGDRGPAGPAGANGAPGAKGAKGDVGPSGPSRWVLVDATGKIEQQSGGFRIANAYPSSGAGNANGANGNVYIESGDADLTNNGIVACAPMDIGVTPNVPTNAKNYFVVGPRPQRRSPDLRRHLADAQQHPEPQAVLRDHLGSRD